MREIPQATRLYLIATIIGLIQTAIAYFVNVIIGNVALLLTGFLFLAAIFAYRGTMGYYHDPNPSRSLGFLLNRF